MLTASWGKPEYMHQLTISLSELTCLLMDDIRNYVKNGDDSGGTFVQKIIKTESMSLRLISCGIKYRTEYDCITKPAINFVY